MEYTTYPWRFAELDDLPRLAQGQADDLKVDTGTGTRVWLSRCGVADGEPFENTVTVEQYDGQRWVTAERYCGDTGQVAP
jgi:hypothetical protein